MDWPSFQNHTQKTQLFRGIGTISPHHSAAMLSSRWYFFIWDTVWREHEVIVRRLARDFLFVCLSPWPMYYRCKWSVQLFLIVLFTYKCLRNEVIGSPTLSAEMISRSKTINRTLEGTIKFCLQDFCLRYYLYWSQIWSLCKVRHLWHVLWLKLADVFIRYSLINPSQWFSTHDCCPTQTTMCKTQYPWSMYCWWCIFLFLFDS